MIAWCLTVVANWIQVLPTNPTIQSDTAHQDAYRDTRSLRASVRDVTSDVRPREVVGEQKLQADRSPRCRLACLEVFRLVHSTLLPVS